MVDENNNKNFKKLTILFDSSPKHESHAHSMDTASNRRQHRHNEKAWPRNLEEETEIKAIFIIDQHKKGENLTNRNKKKDKTKPFG